MHFVVGIDKNRSFEFYACKYASTSAFSQEAVIVHQLHNDPPLYIVMPLRTWNSYHIIVQEIFYEFITVT